MSPASAADRLMLWAGTVRTRDLAGRLAVARAGGFTAQSAFPSDVKNWLEQGHTLSGLREQARAAQVPITVLDPLTQWLPRWEMPTELDAGARTLVDFSETTFFEYASGLAVDKMSVIEPFGAHYELGEFVAAFQRVCDIARERDLRVQLEFMPIGSVPDLATAWEIVRRADRANGGIAIDTWHYYRGNPDDALLAQIPGEKIFGVQVADADATIQGGSLFADLMHYRRLPGAGSFPLPDMVRLLRATGGLGDVGVEIFADEMDALEPAEVGRRCGAALRQLLATAPPTA